MGDDSATTLDAALSLGLIRNVTPNDFLIWLFFVALPFLRDILRLSWSACGSWGSIAAKAFLYRWSSAAICRSISAFLAGVS
jgi:hypothetical protein